MKYTINGEYVERWRYLEHLIEVGLETMQGQYIEWLADNNIYNPDDSYYLEYEEWVARECESSLKYDEEHACGSVGD